MLAYLDTFNQLLAWGTIVLQLIIVVLVCALVFFRSPTNTVLLFCKRYGISFGFLLAFSSMGLSLFYSRIIGFPPCELCIVQRFFIYSQVLLFGLLLSRVQKKLLLNLALLLSVFGSLVSLYHVYIENGGTSTLACATDSINTISCSARYVYEFGYITIPVMALTAQVLLILLILNYKYNTHE